MIFRDWMEAALYDPQAGYYCRPSERWGRRGDYRTSPERSPLFAATMARYLNGLYETLGRPLRWTILEAGAGAGQFAAGLLNSLEQRFPDTFAATHYVVDEQSPAASASARVRLAKFGKRVDYGRLGAQSFNEPTVIFSNELLDSFPIHRVMLVEGELRELYVTLADTPEYIFVPGPLSTPELAEYFELVGIHLTHDDQIADVNLAAAAWLAKMTANLSQGYLITVDYGAEATELYGHPNRKRGTLRAIRRHEFRDPLTDPGENDLTTTVDWTYVKRIGAGLGLKTVDFQRLDQFLLHAGLLTELEVMTERASNEAEKASLRASAREMILPGGMADSFQVLVQKKEGD